MKNKSVIARAIAASFSLLIAQFATGPASLMAAHGSAKLAHTHRAPARATLAESGASKFLFRNWSGPALPVWTYVPEGIDKAAAPILIVMHGARRDADRYRNQWIKPAQQGGFIVIAPEFSKADFPKAARYNLGGVHDRKTGADRAEELWAFSAIEPLFDDAVARLGSNQAGYTLYGHSAGSQFVHRFAVFKPEARAKRYLAANAGWYTFADPAIDFPFGLGGLDISEDRVRQVLAKDLIVLLGSADNDPDANLLNKSGGAMRQGSHRFERGKNFFAAARSLAQSRGWNFGWSLRVVDGVGHSNGKMAPKVYDLVR